MSAQAARSDTIGYETRNPGLERNRVSSPLPPFVLGLTCPEQEVHPRRRDWFQLFRADRYEDALYVRQRLGPRTRCPGDNTCVPAAGTEGACVFWPRKFPVIRRGAAAL